MSDLNDSRIRKSGMNVVTGIAQNSLTILLAFLSRIIFVRVLDASYLGINGLFTNILNFLSLADLGVSTAMMYSLYEPIVSGNYEKITALIDFFKRIYHKIAFAVLVLGLLLLPFLKYIIRLEKEIPNLEWYYILALLNVVISYLFVYRTTLMIADQRGYILNNYIMIFKVATFAAQTAVLFVTQDYFLYLLVALLIGFFSNLTQSIVTVRAYPYLRRKASPIGNRDKKKIYSNVKALFLYKVTAVINNDIDSILISILVGTVFVGYYSNYLTVMSAVVMLITAVFTACKASVGNMIADSGTDLASQFKIYKLIEFGNYWLVSFAAICSVCLLNDCISIFFGSEYVLSNIIVLAIVACFYTSNICQTIWVFRETTGFFQEVKYVMVVHCILNLILSVFLGRICGMFGILAATVISRLCFSGWNEPYVFFKKYFKVSPIGYFQNYLKWLILSITAGTITWKLCTYVNLSLGWIRLLVKMGICILTPNLLFGLFFCRSKEIKQLYEVIIKPIWQKRNVKG